MLTVWGKNIWDKKQEALVLLKMANGNFTSHQFLPSLSKCKWGLWLLFTSGQSFFQSKISCTKPISQQLQGQLTIFSPLIAFVLFCACSCYLNLRFLKTTFSEAIFLHSYCPMALGSLEVLSWHHVLDNQQRFSVLSLPSFPKLK